MAFIELTSYETGRTLHVRADRVGLIVDYINDEAGDKYTRVWVGGPSAEVELHVMETQEDVLRRIKYSELQESKETNAQLSAIASSFSATESKGVEPPLNIGT